MKANTQLVWVALVLLVLLLLFGPFLGSIVPGGPEVPATVTEANSNRVTILVGTYGVAYNTLWNGGTGYRLTPGKATFTLPAGVDLDKMQVTHTLIFSNSCVTGKPKAIRAVFDRAGGENEWNVGFFVDVGINSLADWGSTPKENDYWSVVCDQNTLSRENPGLGLSGSVVFEVPAPVCGNSVCELGEDSNNCAIDCPVTGPVCGNAVCELGEDANNCATDCAPMPPEITWLDKLKAVFQNLIDWIRGLFGI